MVDFAVKAENLTKKFGDFTAVDSISFEVEKGAIYGFLGANGAGKSTTIRMLCGILEPTSGDAEVAGFSVKKDSEQVKKKLGYMSQKFSLYNNLTVIENLVFYAGIYGLDRDRINERQGKVLEQIQLAEYKDTVVNVLPVGIKQRVALSCALMHEPEIIFLDEPTAGVDLVLRRRFWEIIDGLSKAGKTVFVTTHYMDEVEHCHKVALMNMGKIIKEGTLKDIKTSTFPSPILEIETDDVVKAYECLSKISKELGSISMYGGVLHVIPFPGITNVEEIIDNALKQNQIKYSKPVHTEPSIADVFVKLVRSL